MEETQKAVLAIIINLKKLQNTSAPVDQKEIDKWIDYLTEINKSIVLTDISIKVPGVPTICEILDKYTAFGIWHQIQVIQHDIKKMKKRIIENYPDITEIEILKDPEMLFLSAKLNNFTQAQKKAPYEQTM